MAHRSRTSRRLVARWPVSWRLILLGEQSSLAATSSTVMAACSRSSRSLRPSSRRRNVGLASATRICLPVPLVPPMRIFSHIPGSNARGIILWQVPRTCATVRAQRMCCVTPLLTLTATQAGSIRGQSRFPSRAGAWSAPDPQGLALRHTGVMTIRNVAAAREALRAGKPDLLVGTREGGWLDANGEPYQLNEPKWAAELGKDVAALANAGGRLIVIGLRTRRESGSDVIGEAPPVPAKLIERD